MKPLAEVNQVTDELLRLISNPDKLLGGAFNIRENGQCAARHSTANIKLDSMTDKPGMTVTVAPGTHGETVYIPACVTKSGFEDLVYNDFFIGDGADVLIVAGCGVHSDGEDEARHDGIHRFFIGENARVRYVENHIGVGEGKGKRVINPKTEIEIKPGGYFEMDSTQIKGVDSTNRVTVAKLELKARLVIREKLMTHGEQAALTDFFVDLDGDDSGADVVSRSVARDTSKQVFRSVINGRSRCTGHSACDAIIMDAAVVSAIPELTAHNVDAALIHEAAIGKIAGEQLIKLMTLGLTREEAEARIINGFLK